MVRSRVGHSASSMALLTTSPTNRESSMKRSSSRTTFLSLSKSHLSNTTPRHQDSDPCTVQSQVALREIPPTVYWRRCDRERYLAHAERASPVRDRTDSPSSDYRPPHDNTSSTKCVFIGFVLLDKANGYLGSQFRRLEALIEFTNPPHNILSVCSRLQGPHLAGYW
jgi:hypothetical protein